MSTTVILGQMGVIAILVLIGATLYKKDIINNEVSKSLSTLVMDVTNPALILASILSGNMTATHHDLITAMIIGVCFYAVLVAMGFFLPKLLKAPKDDKKFYNVMTVYTNIGFIGIPVAKAILPENAILYVIVCNVMYSLLFYTHGITILSGGKEKMSIKKAFNAGTITAILSLIIFWFGITPWSVITNCICYIGNANVFLSMTLLGLSIARSGINNGLRNSRIWFYMILRMIAFPVAISLILMALHFSKITILAMCLMAAMPVGNLPLIQSEKNGDDTTLLAGAITMTTIVSMLTITVLMSIFSAIG